jgi:hypothetical protein
MQSMVEGLASKTISFLAGQPGVGPEFSVRQAKVLGMEKTPAISCEE